MASESIGIYITAFWNIKGTDGFFVHFSPCSYIIAQSQLLQHSLAGICLDSFKHIETACKSFNMFELRMYLNDYQKMMALYLTSLQGI